MCPERKLILSNILLVIDTVSQYQGCRKQSGAAKYKLTRPEEIKKAHVPGQLVKHAQKSVK